MTVVYLDSLFLLNTLVNYILLLAAARVAGETLFRVRFFVAAVVGGLYACAIFLPGLQFLMHPLCKIGAAVLMALIAYGSCRRLVRVFLWFLALSCVLGGGVLAIGLIGGRAVGLQEGILFPRVDLKVVLLSAAVCYLVFGWIFRRVGAKRSGVGGIVQTTVEFAGHRVSFQALVDTGNALSDPVSGRPVLVVEGARLTPLFPPGQIPQREDLQNPAEAMTRLSEGALRGKLRLLPYRAVGVEKGLLLCLKADRVIIDGEEKGPLLVALAPDPVSDRGSHCALIGMMEGG